ncbi:carbon dioxide concentrating mechanism protein [Crocosphaera subtropica ATCC 51142]|uniref:Carbon dioxide concentrating mechanism protein n=1 Tax=Crocosphaera subtropica (strain ATCC 51142 / BH68) TaxID=43989 RepID=B1WSP8_CROS5|nr:transferase [Crocosphaera subtropica]ACB53627.1 carbon dioxide concentrating mechanism protein [Crocosphaera subtropica ATCC 51142]
MPLPLIQPPSRSEVSIIGEVIIHEGAVVAPGTILQAAPDCRIVIHQGACIGMGTLINAYQGDIEIKSGAMLGAGVLIVGQGTIGQNVCLGSCTTVINTSIKSGTTIEAGSLVGDTSRQFPEKESASSQGIKEDNNGFSDDRHLTANTQNKESQTNKNSSNKPEFVQEMEDLWADPEPEIEEVTEIPEIPTKPNAPADNNNAPVVGQVYINQLLCTLFPDRQAFNQSQNHSASDNSANNNK